MPFLLSRGFSSSLFSQDIDQSNNHLVYLNQLNMNKIAHKHESYWITSTFQNDDKFRNKFSSDILD